MTKLTKARCEALEWFVQHGPEGLFGIGDPSLVTVKRLAAEGLLDKIPPAQGLGIIRYQISDAGRAALAPPVQP